MFEIVKKSKPAKLLGVNPFMGEDSANRTAVFVCDGIDTSAFLQVPDGGEEIAVRALKQVFGVYSVIQDFMGRKRTQVFDDRTAQFVKHRGVPPIRQVYHGNAQPAHEKGGLAKGNHRRV
jgi:hypothetical protein